MENKRGRFFSVVKRKSTYFHLFYLLLSLPLGLLYFIILFTGVLLSVILSLVWVGIPLMLIFVTIARGFMSFERRMAGRLLHIYVEPDVFPEIQGGFWNRLKGSLKHKPTQKGFMFILIKLPLGLASFLIGMLFFVVILIFFIVPVFYFFLTNKFSIQQAAYSNIFFNPVTAMLVSIIFIMLGVVVSVLSLHAINFISHFSGKIAAKMLGHKGEYDIF